MVSSFISSTFVFLAALSLTTTLNPYLTNNHRQSIHERSINQVIAPNISNDPFIIVIDPGHGGIDHGCNGHSHKEKSFTLPFALRLGQEIQLLSNNKVKVLYTRSNDISVSLSQRTRIANAANADLFISIHANSINDPTIHGYETYVYGNPDPDDDNSNLTVSENDHSYSDVSSHILSNIASSNHQKASIRLANAINNYLEGTVKIKNRGVKQAEFRVLKEADMPSVLLELGYLTNPTDKEILLSEEGQEILSNKIAKAIIDYLEG